MNKKNQFIEFFNTKNSLKLSLICLTIFHLFWKLLPPPLWYPDFNNGIITFIESLLIYGCLYVCGLLLIWVFGLTITQIFSSYFNDINSPNKTPSTVTLLCYSISNFLIFALSFSLGQNAHPMFFIFNSYPVFTYAFVNSIGAFIILIFKLICQALSLKRCKTASASDNSLTIKKANTDQKAGTGKFSIKKLLIFAAVYLFVLTCSNSIIGKGLMTPYFEGDIHDILSVVMFLCFILYWIDILLAFALAIKDSVTPKNQVAWSDLFNYLTYSSVYYLLALTILYPLTGELSGTTAGEQFGIVWLINYSLYIILNYIAVLIILPVKAFKKALPE